MHLSEDAGGQGATLADMACVLEAATAALLPGPLLSTATASAVAGLADTSAAALIAELAGGATAAVVLPEHCDVRAARVAAGWRLDGSSHTTLGICAAQRVLLAACSEDGAQLWFVLDPRSPGSGLVQRSAAPICAPTWVC